MNRRGAHPGVLPGLRIAALVTVLSGPASAYGQQPAPEISDPARARLLHVSNRPEDHDPARDHDLDVLRRLRTDSVFAARAAGVLDYAKVSWPSPVDGLEIPAHLYQPLEKRGARGHPALVWVHGGIHGNWTEVYWPFIREAVERGYVVIAPDYRGSTGYGAVFHDAIDYGGHEVDDVMAARDWMGANLPHVDPDRVGIMGWSHGGFISLHALFREGHPFVAGAAIVPVANLVFRLSYKGPAYQRLFSTQKRIRGLPFERRELYVERSPVYQVDRLDVPLLVHVATNDEDVDFVEAEMLVHALQVKKPELAELRVYEDPEGGHSFSVRVDPISLERMDTPEQRDSWNRVWTFLEWNLRPYEAGPPSP